MGAFGEKLRRQREQRGLELEAISNTTKISPRMLRALEDEHFDQLPGGVFNKGFVRAYARQVGLDEEEAIADYLAALRESQVQQQAILPDFRSTSGTGRKPATPAIVPSVDHPAHKNILGDFDPENLTGRTGRTDKVVPPVAPNPPVRIEPTSDDRRQPEPWAHSRQPQRSESDGLGEGPTHPESEIFPTQGFITGPGSGPQSDDSAPLPWKQFGAALLVIIVVFGFWNLRHHSAAKVADQLPQAIPAPSKVASSAPSPAPRVSSPVADSAVIPASQTSAPPASIAPKPVPLRSSFQERPTPAAKPAAATATNSIPAPSLPPAIHSKLHPPAVKPPATFTLLIRAEKTTWVSIVADGKPVAEETLIAPAHTSVRASHEIYVRAGNSAGVSFVLNGREISTRGGEGEVKAYLFDASGLHSAPQSPAP